jgi:uncharacterized PurR-regulated membrane protein YhhQ (DUF165 family)
MKKLLSPPWLFFLAGLWAFVLGSLMRLRVFPFLHDDTILASGRLVSTEQWAASASTFFFIGGAVAIVIGFAAIFFTRRRPRDDANPKI